MAATSTDCKVCAWHVSGHSLNIQYLDSVLAEINTKVVEGFNRFRRGGIEVGGVLFGSYQEGTIRILAFRPLDCEHLFGPNFLLSDRDRSALDELFERALADRALQGLIPVGWYRSRTRKDIHLSTEDVEIFDRYFPEPWHVTLVLRPDSFVPTKAGFFFREAGGAVRTESSYSEFSLGQPQVESESKSNEKPKHRPTSVRAEPPIEPERKEPAAQRESSLPANEPQPEPLASAPFFEQRSAGIPSTVKSLLYATALGLILAGLYFGMARNSQRDQNRTSLIVEDRAGQLWIGWDPKRWESIVKTARLEIHDGDHTTFLDLDKTQLRSGSVTYSPQSGNVWVRMQADGAEEWVAFLGPSVPPVESARPNPQTPEVQATVEKDSHRRQLDQQADEIRRLEDLVESFKGNKTTAPEPPKVRPFLEPRKELRTFAIPTLEAPLIERPGSPVASNPLLGNLTPAVPISAPRRDTQPRSGTMIWTGRLAPNGILTIEGGLSSAGALTGELPGVPLRLNVFPAQLTEEGLTIFTSSTKYADGHLEPAGPANGWNRTRYLRDAARASALAVLEFPSAVNGWKRLVLRNDRFRVSVVVIEWTTYSH